MSRERTVGVVMDSDFEYGMAVYEGIRLAAGKLPGWNLAPFTHPRQDTLLKIARTGRLDGVIMPVISDRWVAPLLEVLPAVVNISSLSRIESVSSAVPDDFRVGGLAASHMLEMGVSRCGVIGERSVHASACRRDGFVALFGKQGREVLQPDSDQAYTYESGWEQWLRSLAGEIHVYGTSDRVVSRFMRVYNVLRDDLDVVVGAVVGTGNSLAERTLSGIDLSSVVLPGVRVGVEAVALMKERLEGGPVRKREVTPDELIVRGSSTAAVTGDSVIGRARGYIERSIAEAISVHDVARCAGASRRTLEMRFRTRMGISPAEYIRRRRMKLAERLLVETALSVREIAARCGAGSLQAFTSAFRKRHGMPPARYRAVHGNLR